MSNQLLTLPKKPRASRLTARDHIIANLVKEILSNPQAEAFPIASENELCRRFGVSRVTVRLALADLENRGLIYRQHGKGTFAHGRSTQIHRHIGVLIKTPLITEDRPLAEFLRGVQTFVRPLRSAVILIGHSPEEWRPELACALAGVIVIAENVTTHDLDSLNNRKLPFLIVGEIDLPGARISLNLKATDTDISMDFHAMGQHAAKALNHAFLSGTRLEFSIDALDQAVTNHLKPASSYY